MFIGIRQGKVSIWSIGNTVVCRVDVCPVLEHTVTTKPMFGVEDRRALEPFFSIFVGPVPVRLGICPTALGEVLFTDEEEVSMPWEERGHLVDGSVGRVMDIGKVIPHALALAV